jgi:hypothetical protein
MAQWLAAQISVLEKFGLKNHSMDKATAIQHVSNSLKKYYDADDITITDNGVNVKGSLSGWFYKTSNTDVLIGVDVVDDTLMFRADGDVGISYKSLIGCVVLGFIGGTVNHGDVFGVILVILILNIAGFWLFERPRAVEGFSNAFRALRFDLGSH